MLKQIMTKTGLPLIIIGVILIALLTSITLADGPIAQGKRPTPPPFSSSGFPNGTPPPGILKQMQQATPTPSIGNEHRSSKGILVRNPNALKAHAPDTHPVPYTVDLASQLDPKNRIAVRVLKANGQKIRYLLGEEQAIENILEPGDRLISVAPPLRSPQRLSKAEQSKISPINLSSSACIPGPLPYDLTKVSISGPCYPPPPDPTPAPTPTLTNYHNWVETVLPTIWYDEVQNATDYYEWIHVAQGLAEEDCSDYQSGCGTVSGWLAVYVDDEPSLGNGFIQVGVIVNEYGAEWFISADPDDTRSPTVICDEGEPEWFLGGKNKGCVGDIGEFGVEIGKTFKVQIVTYPSEGFWRLRFYDEFGSPHDVGRIYFTGTTIYNAVADFEQSWWGYSPDDNSWLSGGFHHYRPKYLVAQGGFADWPSSTSTGDPAYITILSTQGVEGGCPEYYGGTAQVDGNPRLWYTGTGGDECFIYPLFTGGGPSTVSLGFVAESIGKVVSSNNGEDYITADRNQILDWELFIIEYLANGKVALLANNGKYVSSNNGSTYLKADRTSIGSWEQFTLIRGVNGDSYLVALKASNNKYVSFNHGSQHYLKADASSIGTTETFRLVSQ